MPIAIESAEGIDALNEFLAFHDTVYEARPVRWPALVGYQLPMLTGESPFAEGRRFLPLVAREDGRIVARVLAAVDERYVKHWDEALGFAAWFEALPGAREASARLMHEACSWLREQGMEAARAGFGLGEFPFAIDEYDSLPAFIARQNPPYYHAFLKDAGFESELGWVDFKIEVAPELVARWESALEAARRAGYEVLPLRDVPEGRRARDFLTVWNEAFDRHWGVVPFTEAEIESLFELQGPMGALDLTVIAYRDGEPAGTVWVFPELTAIALTAPGRAIRPDERLNNLGIGVREPHRGRGLNMACAAYAYLELARRGATHLSYTLVRDDNWPSRRTAEKLGARVWANYMVYRRNFRR